jgi:serine/threonine protein kinase
MTQEPITTGTRVGGRYEILAQLESGTLADIRTARDLVLDRVVNLKLNRVQEAPFTAAFFAQEARLAAGLEHPHLLPIHDYGVHDGVHFLVMRRYDTSLRQHLRSLRGPERMPLETTVRLFRQIASALDHLHTKGAVHGNLKPENIVLDTTSGREVHAFLSDFGVAVLRGRGIGTPVYMAPEQAIGSDVSPATDLFSLGITLYETLTGAVPFAVDDARTMLAQRLSPPDGLYSARRRRSDLPVGVDLVIAGFTQVAPADRFASASRGIEALDRAFHAGGSHIAGPVFISYARSDAAFVVRLIERLKGVGVPVWNDRDIRSGDNWDRAVEAALREAKQMLVVMSPAAVASENVHDEWSYFVEQRKAVYSFVYQPCELPFRLRRRQYVASTGDLLSDVASILEGLAGHREDESDQDSP